jgi:hypothetical protein
MPHSKMEFLMGLGLCGTILRNLRAMGILTMRRVKRTAAMRNNPM